MTRDGAEQLVERRVDERLRKACLYGECMGFDIEGNGLDYEDVGVELEENLDCVEGRVEEVYQTLGRVHMRVPALSMVVCATRSVDA